MPPVMRISEENWKRLKRWATPLEDSANDALSKVLDAAEGKDSQRTTDRPLELEHPLAATETEVKDQGSIDKDEQEEVFSTKGINENFDLKANSKGTPQSAFRFPILDSLYELGGNARTKDVLKVVEKRMHQSLTHADYEQNRNGTDFRWHNRAQWERLRLVHEGLLRNDSGWGIWELTTEGIGVVEARNVDVSN